MKKEENKISKIITKGITFIITTALTVLLIASLFCMYLNLSGKLVAYQVDGPSMEPNYFNSNFVFSSNAYNKDIKRGDVVAIKTDDGDYIIKRLIGLPNDNIEFKDKNIYINGTLFKEDYKLNLSKDYSYQNIQLKNDEIFVVGDNRDVSYDCRSYGPLKQEQIIGKIICQIENKDGVYIDEIIDFIRDVKGE